MTDLLQLALIGLTLMQLVTTVEIRRLRHLRSEDRGMAEAAFAIGKAQGMVLIEAGAISADDLTKLVDRAAEDTRRRIDDHS